MPQKYNENKKEYGKKTTKDRASRNAARAKYEKEKGACKGDIHHKDNNPNNNDLSNLTCASEKKNRGWRKGKKGDKGRSKSE